MYCVNCGHEISNSHDKCPNCGAIVHPNNPPTQQPVVVNVVNNNSNHNQNTNVNGHAYPYKSKWTAFFLCLLLGGLGIHRFYVGKTGTGILWLFTVGFFGIGWGLDLLFILFGAFRDKAGYPLR